MIKRTFLLVNILVFLFTSCNKEQALPPIVKKSLNYENQLKKQQGFSLAEVGLECLGDYDDLFDGEYEFGPQLINPPACFTPDPMDLFYILIDLNGSNLTLNLHFYDDLDIAYTAGEVEFTDPIFSYANDVDSPIWGVNTGESLNLNIAPSQEYFVNFNIIFTDFDCVYEKSAEFRIYRGPTPISGDSSILEVTSEDNTSLIGSPYLYSSCSSGVSALAVIVP